MTLSIQKLTLTLCAMMVTATGFASQASADLYDHIDRMAMDIQRKSRMLLRETVHYRYTPQYPRIVACTSKLYQLATHVHEVTHFEGNLRHLRVDLRDLDSEFQALEDLFDRVELKASRGCSRIVGNTAHVKRLLEAIDQCICNMRDDVEELVALTSCPSRRTRTVPVHQPPVYVPPRTSTFEFNYSKIRMPDYRGRSHQARHPYDRDRVGYGYEFGRPMPRGYGHDRSGVDRSFDRSFDRTGFSIGGGSSRIHFSF